MPIFVSYKCKIKNMGDRNSLIVKNSQTGSIRLGVSNGSFCLSQNDLSFWDIKKNAKVIFEGKCSMGPGARVTVCENATLHFGRNFSANSGFTVSSNKEIAIGDDCLFGWNCTVIDGDGHRIVKKETGEVLNLPQEVFIGNHVWVASNVVILKGTVVKNDSVIAACSCVSKEFIEDNLLIGGIPSRILRTDINWEHEGFISPNNALSGE